ncbi:MAG TPA: pyridoxal-phosphate dependent enzyme [Verrucomicrobiae bacterium]|nr:pyridoxal-phosphate dependent enzyme [Verrucomicrobiae bacterium]
MNDYVCLDRIEAASAVIDPVFRNTPLIWHDELDELAGAHVLVKVETVNPIRSFKGRGTDLFVQRLPTDSQPMVAASAGNFGQGLAFAARKAGRSLTVFAPENGSPVKISAMRRMGANVHLSGFDMDAAKEVARSHAQATNALFVEDGAHPAFAEGAGTIAKELTEAGRQIDTVVVPLGNGALLTGVAAWMKHFSPKTSVLGVVSQGAPAMQLSFARDEVVETERVNTIADGIAVRVPVPFSLDAMRGVVDEVLAVSDEQMLQAMRLAHRVLGLVVEPSGIAGLAAVLADRSRFRGQRLATVFAGGNLSPKQMQDWLLHEDTALPSPQS